MSLFGNGHGECVVCHLGGGAWIVVDSASSDRVTPVALQYLAHIGVDPRDAVKLIVATHFDSDHIRGLDSLVAACPEAAFCTTAAYRDSRFQTLVGLAPPPSPLRSRSSGLSVFQGVNRALAARPLAKREVISAGANKTVFPLHGGQAADYVVALSPADAIVNRVIREVVTRSSPRRPLVKMPQNPISVVLWIAAGDRRILLGADLPRGGTASGWRAIVARGAPNADRAELFKVAHHGSAGCDLGAIWAELLAGDPVALLTPKANSRLPTPGDRSRIAARAERACLAGGAAPARRALDALDWLVEFNTAQRSGIVGPMGQVRARCRANGRAAWDLELSRHASVL